MSYWVLAIAVLGFAAAMAVAFRRRHKPRQESSPESTVAPQRASTQPDACASPSDASDADDSMQGTGPFKLIFVTAAAVTDPGLRRPLNEDAYVCLSEHNAFAIADGMGRQAAGEVASKLTLEAITEAFEENMFLGQEGDQGVSRRMRLQRIIERANQIVLGMGKEIEAYRGMGTTVVLAQFSASRQKVHVAHVGDSRCYRLRGDEITQLTQDHTLATVGILGKTSGILSRAVGIEDPIEVDVCVHEARVGDVYLLCTDGLSRMVRDEVIRQTVRQHPVLEDAARKLVRLANEAGGRDNVTAVLIRVDAAPLSLEPTHVASL